MGYMVLVLASEDEVWPFGIGLVPCLKIPTSPGNRLLLGSPDLTREIMFLERKPVPFPSGVADSES